MIANNLHKKDRYRETMNMKTLTPICFCMILVAALPSAAQEEKAAVPMPAVSGPILSMPVNDDSEGRMLVPPPVSGQSYPTTFSSEERANYLRGGVTFNTAYSDSVLGSTSGASVNDVSYSVWPTIALDETTTRLHTVLTYAPGFTFYQRTTERNQADENFAVDLQYRLSPHVTVSLRDSLQKTSNVFNQPGQGLDSSTSGSAQGANDSVIAPLADLLSNNGNAGISYQFSANAMIGASGMFTNLHYPNPAEVPGLYDAASRGGSAFYSYRISHEHYVGAAYQYQQLLSYPAGATNQTETEGAFFFYTYQPSRTLSFSFFGGPQYYNSGAQILSANAAPIPAAKAWTPAAGGSVNWQAPRTAVALSYSHTVSSGGGLVGAVKLDNANASLRQQLTHRVSASFSGYYANNGVLSLAALGGHSVSASVALQRQIGEHINVQSGYTRLHQTYSFFSAHPDTNREWIAITYQFARPLGR
jgi:hypothetical protein